MTKRPNVGVALVEALVTEGKRLVDEIATSEASLYRRRLAMGTFLLGARAQLPKRGTAEEGWGAFLAAIGVDEMTATRYMRVAERVASLPLTERDKPQTYADAGLDNRPRKGDAGPDDGSVDRHHTGAYISPEQDLGDRDLKPDNTIPPLELDPPAEIEIDRDTWCTPKEWADAIGPVDYDPCSNSRSHVQARRAFDLELRKENGLSLAADIDPNELGFLNPPYSDVMPWIQHYGPKRHIFLLKLDLSTKWFEALLGFSTVVMLPRRTRIQFEAPDGVPMDKQHANQFPHALFYARETDVTDAVRAKCFSPWRIER